MLRRIVLLFVLSFLALQLTGCGAFLIASRESSEAVVIESGTPSVEFALEEEGFDVEVGEAIYQGFFDVEGQILWFNGQEIQVFYFPSEADAEAAAAQFNPDGSLPTMMITWIDTPHFYRSGTVIVLYVGSDAVVQEALTNILGPQFAGG